MIRQQMREAIEQGIHGFLASSFVGSVQPRDPETGYPLTPDNSEAKFSTQYPYQSIEDTFLEHVQWNEDTPLDTLQLQIWLAYFWQYAKLELQERFDPPPYYHTDEMEVRRDWYRNEIVGRGYKRVK